MASAHEQAAQATFLVPSGRDWNKAQTALNRGLAKALRPKLRKVILTAS